MTYFYSLTEPTFISIFLAERRNDSLNEKIYVLFREKNSDTSPEADPWISRVARVCKVCFSLRYERCDGSLWGFLHVRTTSERTIIVEKWPSKAILSSYTLRKDEWPYLIKGFACQGLVTINYSGSGEEKSYIVRNSRRDSNLDYSTESIPGIYVRNAVITFLSHFWWGQHHCYQQS